MVTIREVIEKTYCMLCRPQGTKVVNCAGATIEITPPHAHISLEVFCKAGMLPIRTVGEPGTHGATVIGTQGIGVNAPSAAAVAAATIGLPMQVQVPNGITLTIGA